CYVLVRRGDRYCSILGERHDFHSRIDVSQAGISDTIWVLRHMRCERKHDFLEVDAITPFTSVSRSAQHALPDKFFESIPRFHPVNVDRFIGPFSGEAQIPPCRIWPAAAEMRRRKDAVELVEAQLLNGICLIDYKCHRV